MKRHNIKPVSNYTNFTYSLVFLFLIVVLLNTNDPHCGSRWKLLLTYKQKTTFKKICANIIFSTNNHNSSKNSVATWSHHSSKCSGHKIYEADDIYMIFSISHAISRWSGNEKVIKHWWCDSVTVNQHLVYFCGC